MKKILFTFVAFYTANSIAGSCIISNDPSFKSQECISNISQGLACYLVDPEVAVTLLNDLSDEMDEDTITDVSVSEDKISYRYVPYAGEEKSFTIGKCYKLFGY